MGQPTTILPIPGVPDELIRVLNVRFGELSTGGNTAAAAIVPGLFFRTKARPDANGTAVGTYGTDTETGILYQVQTVSSAQIWVEVIQPGDAQTAQASGNVTLPVGAGSATDVTGATITLARAGRYAITGVFDFLTTGVGDIGQQFFGALMVNGALVASPLAVWVNSSNGSRACVAQQWLSTVIVSSVVAKLRCYKAAGTGTSTVQQTNTSILATWIGP